MQVGLQVGLVGSLEAARLERLTRKGFDHSHTCQVLLQHGIERSQSGLHLLEQGTDGHHKAPDEQQHQRDGRQGDKGQPPVHQQQQHGAAQDHDQGVDKLEESHPGELAHHLHVAGEARHQLAGLSPVVIAEAETLDFIEEGVAHVEGHVLRCLLRPISLGEVEHASHHGHAYQAQRTGCNDRYIAWRNAVVYHPADDLRDDQIGGRHQYQAGHRANGYQPIWS